jgi:Bacteriophage tail sheath protein
MTMTTSPTIPGLYYNFVQPPAEPSPVRTDVAGFFGRTERGPVGTPVRVRGWREYMNVFGGLLQGAMTTYSVQGYFENQAEVAYVVRLLGAESQCASAVWVVGTFDAASGTLDPAWPGAANFQAIQFQLKASTPGDWANNTLIQVRYWAYGPSGKPELEIEISPPNEDVETLTGIDPSAVDTQVNAKSKYVRMAPLPLPPALPSANLGVPPGPRYYEWPPFTLLGGTSLPPAKEDYLSAITALGDQLEVALVLCPDLYHPDFYQPNSSASTADVVDVISAMLVQADRLHDRLVIFDIPPDQADPFAAVQWIDSQLRNPPAPAEPLADTVLRNGAVYHPRLLVPDPLGSAVNPLLCVPCSGLVTGVISRLDLQEGAYLTPANAPIYGAVDLSRNLNANEQAAIYSGGLNLLTCSPAQGLLIWGGRVLGASTPPGGFLAHRRLIHLLVRAIRRVAEPLVFDTNGPQLWLAFVRCITTVLLEAFRAGALQGDTPDQAFRVQCDATTNPSEQVAQGMCLCLIQIAPAVPMEFITLRVAVSDQGQLEVFES